MTKPDGVTKPASDGLTKPADGVTKPADGASTASADYPRWLTPLHQRHNAAMATAMMTSLAQRGHLRPGLADTWRAARNAVFWPCRFEVLRPAALGPRTELLIDVAHNEPAVAALIAAVEESYPAYTPIVLIFGANLT